MASQLSDIFGLVGTLEEYARRGDWQNAGKLALTLRQRTLPASREGLGEFLRVLKQALIAAKVSRAHSAASLAGCNTAAVRLNAAASFNRIRLDLASPRHEFGEPPDF